MNRTDNGRFTRTLIALELLLCVAAAGGGVQLAAVAPHDAMPADVLARTPFSSWVWPGVLLVATVAAPAGLVAAGALAGRAWSHVGHPVVGLLLIGWIGVQVLVIGPVSVLQPFMAAWGLAIAALGAAHYRHWHLGRGATPAAPRAGDGLRERADTATTAPVSLREGP